MFQTAPSFPGLRLLKKDTFDINTVLPCSFLQSELQGRCLCHKTPSPMVHAKSFKIDFPIVPSGISTPKFSAIEAPITANVS